MFSLKYTGKNVNSAETKVKPVTDSFIVSEKSCSHLEEEAVSQKENVFRPRKDI